MRTPDHGTFKFYDLYANESRADQKTSDLAIAEVVRLAKSNELTDDTIGFVISHQGRDANWLVVGFWQSGGIVELNTFSAPLDRSTGFIPVKGNFIICVWELGIVDFERKAWLTHGLGDNPDLEAYLASTLSGLV